MFESAEIGHKLGKSVFKREEPKLRHRLLELQHRVADRVCVAEASLLHQRHGDLDRLLDRDLDPLGFHGLVTIPGHDVLDSLCAGAHANR